MKKIVYSFLSVKNSLTVSIIVKNEDIISKLIGDWISLFEHNINTQTRKIELNGLQKKSIAFMVGFNKYLSSYDTFIPQLNQVKKFLNTLNENEHFLFLPSEEISRANFYFGLNNLNAIQNNTSYEDTKQEFDRTFGKILKTYQITSASGNRKYFFGEQDKEKRKCRFCGLNKANGVTFKNTSHTISEALGNKNIFTNDECDNCNELFNKTIEGDIITYLAFHRVLFNIKGKSGSVKLKGKNFNLSNDGEVKITIKGEAKEDRKNDYSLQLETHSKITSQNIYKSLCKFAIGILPNNKLIAFSKTIDFLNSKLIIEKLPKIAVATNLYGLIKHPELLIYIRKRQNLNLPLGYVLFKFANLAYIFILPSNSDKKDFSNDNEFDKFWKSIPVEISSNNWQFIDFSDRKPKKLFYNPIIKVQKN